jgi:hypothetical protein
MLRILDKFNKLKFVLRDEDEEPVSIDELILRDKDERKTDADQDEQDAPGNK